MSRRSLDLLLCIVVAVIGTALAVVPLPGAAHLMRVAFTLPLVLALPGYTLLAALIPTGTLDGVARLLLSLGLSLALAIVGGLLLNLMPWGLQAGSWTALLCGLTLCAATVALTRRRGPLLVVPRGQGVGLTVRQRVLVGAAALVAGGAIRIASAAAARPPTPGFTQLWMVPGSADTVTSVRLGVRNVEGTAMRYRLKLMVGSYLVRDWTDVTLKPNQTWQSTTVLPAGLQSGPTRYLFGVPIEQPHYLFGVPLDPPEIHAGTVRAVLYQSEGVGKPYRQVFVQRG